ncbi:hypothetical protein A4A49_63109, partial [Nicotiana attenuata]
SNLPSNANEDIQVIPLVVATSFREGYVTTAAEAEVLPSVEEIIPRNPDAKLNLQRQSEVVAETSPPKGPHNEVSKRNLALMPSFRRRRGMDSSTPAPISTAMHIPPLAPPSIEDEEVSPRNTDLRPRKRKAINGEEGVPMVVDLSEVSPEVAERDVVAAIAERDTGAAI